MLWQHLPLFVDGEKQDILVTAWYAPDIPVRFGPIGYGGLPGLILELQNESATFYVTKINLNQILHPK
jgi:GLPGLI family protein